MCCLARIYRSRRQHWVFDGRLSRLVARCFRGLDGAIFVIDVAFGCASRAIGLSWLGCSPPPNTASLHLIGSSSCRVPVARW